MFFCIYFHGRKKKFWNECLAFKKNNIYQTLLKSSQYKEFMLYIIQTSRLCFKNFFFETFWFQKFFFETFWIQKFFFLRRFILDINIFLLVKHSFCLKNKCFFAFIFMEGKKNLLKRIQGLRKKEFLSNIIKIF